MNDEKGPLVYVRSTDDDCWFLNGHTVGLDIEWLVDSGAGHSLIDFQKFMQIDPTKRPCIEPCPIRLRGAGGESLKVYGEVVLEVMLGRYWYEIPTVVADLGNLEGLLGIRYLRSANECQMDFIRGILSVDDNKIQLHVRSYEGISHVRAESGFVIPAEHEIVVSGVLSCRPLATEQGLIEPCDDFFHRTGILIPKALVYQEQGRVMVVLANFSEDPVRIKPGTILGTWAPADELETVDIAPVLTGKGPPQKKTCKVDQLPEHLRPLAANAAGRLNEEEVELLGGLLAENQDVFVGPDGQVGRTGIVKHAIHTGPGRPIKKPPRRFADCQRKIVEQEVDAMMEKGIIKESDSPWASQVVLVAKKDGSVRFCIDYRHLNEATEKDAYPLPYISDCMDALHGAQWFSTLDLASGYWQVEVEEADRQKTAFVTRKGLYEFNVMPFGLCNAPATFERLMEKVLRGLQWETCLVYLDDIIVLGRTFDEALGNLATVFSRLHDAGLKLKPKKCDLLREKVAFLGHVVGCDGVQCDPKKIEAVRDWKVPSSVTEVKSFMGLASYYRKFIQDFSKVAEPLNALTKKVQEFQWTERCQEAFELLKAKLTEAPILSYPSHSEEDLFILDTDASDVGVGAVLSQVQNGEEKVISYASKTLSPSQRKYCVTYRELLAVVLFVNQFRHYLLGRRFKIRTDHVSLKWLMRFKDAEAMVGRWVLQLSTFNFEIEHRRGVNHGNADALSRKVPKRRMACMRDRCPECPAEDVLVGKHACSVGMVSGLPSVQKGGVPLEQGQKGNSGRLTCSQGQAKDSLQDEKRELSSKPDPEMVTEVWSSRRFACSEGAVGGAQADQWRGVPSELGQGVPAGTLLHQPKGTLPCDYICEPFSESEDEAEDSLRGKVDCEAEGPHVHYISLGERNQLLEHTDIYPVGPEPPEAADGLADLEGEGMIDQGEEGVADAPNWLDTWSPDTLRQMQGDDPVVGRILGWMADEVGKPDRETLLGHDDDTRALCAQWSTLVVKDGVLYRKCVKKEAQEAVTTFQLVTPLSLRAKIFHEVHASRTGGHLGTKRVIAQVRKKFYWPRCKNDLKRWCRECGVCAQIKPGPGHRAALRQIPIGSRLDRVHIDVVGELPETDRGNKYILVLTDHFSKWAHAWALPNQLAQTVADAVMTDFFMVFGLPRQIHTDQGPNFESHLFSQMCEMLGIEKTRTTPYRPQSDGHVERYNRTLQQMLKAYVGDNRDDWDDHLPYVMAAL